MSQSRTIPAVNQLHRKDAAPAGCRLHKALLDGGHPDLSEELK